MTLTTNSDPKEEQPESVETESEPVLKPSPKHYRACSGFRRSELRRQSLDKLLRHDCYSSHHLQYQSCAGESGKSTIFKQIKLLFQTGFDEAELKSYTSVIHANVFQTIKILYVGSKKFVQNSADSSKYVVLSEIGGRLDYPRLTKELRQETEALWRDLAIQETYSRGNDLQVPDCADFFMENLQRLSEINYIPTSSKRCVMNTIFLRVKCRFCLFAKLKRITMGI